jgi:hypothetical protein
VRIALFLEVQEEDWITALAVPAWKIVLTTIMIRRLEQERQELAAAAGR